MEEHHRRRFESDKSRTHDAIDQSGYNSVCKNTSINEASDEDEESYLVNHMTENSRLSN